MSPRKRRLRLHWTCSDYVRHYHRWRWSAALCGRVQYFVNICQYFVKARLE